MPQSRRRDQRYTAQSLRRVRTATPIVPEAHAYFNSLQGNQGPQQSFSYRPASIPGRDIIPGADHQQHERLEATVDMIAATHDQFPTKTSHPLRTNAEDQDSAAITSTENMPTPLQDVRIRNREQRPKGWSSRDPIKLEEEDSNVQGSNRTPPRTYTDSDGVEWIQQNSDRTTMEAHETLPGELRRTQTQSFLEVFATEPGSWEAINDRIGSPELQQFRDRTEWTPNRPGNDEIQQPYRVDRDIAQNAMPFVSDQSAVRRWVAQQLDSGDLPQRMLNPRADDSSRLASHQSGQNEAGHLAGQGSSDLSLGGSTLVNSSPEDCSDSSDGLMMARSRETTPRRALTERPRSPQWAQFEIETYEEQVGAYHPSRHNSSTNLTAIGSSGSIHRMRRPDEQMTEESALALLRQFAEDGEEVAQRRIDQ